MLKTNDILRLVRKFSGLTLSGATWKKLFQTLDRCRSTWVDSMEENKLYTLSSVSVIHSDNDVFDYGKVRVLL